MNKLAIISARESAVCSLYTMPVYKQKGKSYFPGENTLLLEETPN